MEQKLGPNIAAGFVLEVMIVGPGKIHLYATEHLTIKMVGCLAIKHATINIQIYSIGMPANKSAGNAVLGIELIKRSTDISPVSGIRQTERMRARVNRCVGKPANGGLHIPGIAVRGLGIQRERTCGHCDSNG